MFQKLEFSDNHNNAFSLIADFDGDFNDLLKSESLPSELPILPVRHLVLFPGVVSPILIGRDSSMRLVRKAERAGSLIGILCQHDPDVDEPGKDDLCEFGVFARVVKQITLPSGAVTAIVQGLGRLRLLELTKEMPFLMGRVEPTPELMPDKHDKEWKTAMDDLRRLADQYINLSEDLPD